MSAQSNRPVQSYDAAIVGAGVIGLACAWRAAQRGMRVCVIERDHPGAGASRVAAGMLAPVTEVEFGADALLELNLASARRYPDFVAELESATGLTTGYRRCGALHLGLDRDEVEELQRLHELQLSLGLEAEWLAPRECRRLEPGISTHCAGGIHVPAEGQVDPRALVAALAAAVELAGGVVLQGTEVTAAILDGERIAGLETADGDRLAAGQVVLASGCWSGQAPWLPAGARPPVRPVKGQILRLRGHANEPVCDRLVRTPWVYVLSRRDGEVVIGATMEERGYDTTVTAGGVHELLREAYRVLPGVAELELVEAGAGLRPGSPDNAPLIGPGALEGLLLASGHHRNGILLAPATAAIVAAMLVAETPDPPVEPFAPARFERVPALGTGEPG